MKRTPPIGMKVDFKRDVFRNGHQVVAKRWTQQDHIVVSVNETEQTATVMFVLDGKKTRNNVSHIPFDALKRKYCPRVVRDGQRPGNSLS